MGNKIEPVKVKQFVTEISETTEITETFLKSEFRSLYDSLGKDIRYNQEFMKVLKENILELDLDSIIKFIKNLIVYLNLLIKENTLQDTKNTLDILLLLIDSLFEKEKNFRQIFIQSINSIINKDPDDEEIKEIFVNTFPFNVVYLCIDLYTNQEIFINFNFTNSSENEPFEISYLLSKILFNLIYFQKNNEQVSKSYVEHFDSFKFFLSCEKIFSKEKIEKFIANLFFTFSMNFNKMIKNYGNKKDSTENFSIINFYLFLWFCYDYNKFFFSECTKDILNNEVTEIFFENEFNEKVFNLIQNILFSENKMNIVQVINNYNNLYSEIISNTVLYNTNVFKEFIYNFFENYEKFGSSFKLSVKVLLIYIFETIQVINIFKNVFFY
jgi:hypothetical protein